jgi:hypothetical protein
LNSLVIPASHFAARFSLGAAAEFAASFSLSAAAWLHKPKTFGRTQ